MAGKLEAGDVTDGAGRTQTGTERIAHVPDLIREHGVDELGAFLRERDAFVRDIDQLTGITHHHDEAGMAIIEATERVTRGVVDIGVFFRTTGSLPDGDTEGVRHRSGFHGRKYP